MDVTIIAIKKYNKEYGKMLFTTLERSPEEIFGNTPYLQRFNYRYYGVLNNMHCHYFEYFMPELPPFINFVFSAETTNLNKESDFVVNENADGSFRSITVIEADSPIRFNFVAHTIKMIEQGKAKVLFVADSSDVEAVSNALSRFDIENFSYVGEYHNGREYFLATLTETEATRLTNIFFMQPGGRFLPIDVDFTLDTTGGVLRITYSDLG